ncbi:hypothetical protein GCM10010112_30660 [Actinoplanes lobatus]|uniref:Uncharacterized protein n=1 Tax=Actinoplanes lobatus TaxID=113568 RepID=A0ABQ4A8I0_9ACTN|nr:hypothetical protein GCM10010112_30660 [Actinoplanes lobatus]GIE37312.1 hypothetical protein Alo02nite_02100 [Actinoplanes lobatus]
MRRPATDPGAVESAATFPLVTTREGRFPGGLGWGRENVPGGAAFAPVGRPGCEQHDRRRASGWSRAGPYGT